MPTRIRRVLLKEHPRIVEIRFSEHENRLRDLSRVTDMDYLWFSESPGIWVWDEDRQIPSFFAADVRDGTICALVIDKDGEQILRLDNLDL